MIADPKRGFAHTPPLGSLGPVIADPSRGFAPCTPWPDNEQCLLNLAGVLYYFQNNSWCDSSLVFTGLQFGDHQRDNRCLCVSTLLVKCQRKIVLVRSDRMIEGNRKHESVIPHLLLSSYTSTIHYCSLYIKNLKKELKTLRSSSCKTVKVFLNSEFYFKPKKWINRWIKFCVFLLHSEVSCIY